MDPFVVLVSPKYAGNVGSIARVMKNFCLSRLMLVDPRADHLSEEALSLASGAEDLLEAALTVSTLQEAVSDCSIVLGTTSIRNRNLKHPPTPLREASDKLFTKQTPDWSLVFGPEDRGLSKTELNLCTHTVTIPTSETFPTMNLAQSVAISLYELAGRLIEKEIPDEEIATHGEREAALFHIKEALLKLGFLSSGNPDHIMRDLRSFSGRARLTIREIKILRGIAHKLIRLSKYLPESVER